MADSSSRSHPRAAIWPIAWSLLIIGLVCLGLSVHLAPPESSWAAFFLGLFTWVGAAAFCALALKGLSWAHDFWVALAAMWRPLALVLVGAFLLFFNDQGRELGVSLMIDDIGGGHLVFLFVALFLALLYWSLNNWHSARLGVRGALDNGDLGVRPKNPLPEKPDARVIGEHERWLFWLPRLLGVCAHLFAAINLSMAASRQSDFAQPLVAWMAPIAIAAFTGLVYIFDHYALSEKTPGEKSALARFISLGGAGLLLLALCVLAGFHSGVWSRFLWGTFTLSLSAFAFLILVSFLRRGKLLGVDASEKDRREDDRIEDESLAGWTRWLFVPTLLIFALVWISAPLVGRALGSMVVAYFALGAALATVNAFELVLDRLIARGWFGRGARRRVVSGYAVAALLALGFLNAWLHPFHRVRRCEGMDCVAPTSAAAYVHEPDSRPTVEAAAQAWYKQAKAAFIEAHGGKMDENDRVPMVVVATAGGGIRAAYWTATVLERIKQDLGPRGLRPYLFAISGVSGGSLGATAFDAALARGDETACGRTCERSTQFLREDFLAPTLASWIFKDVPSSFLPDLGQDDRGGALEQSFEHASFDLLGRPFLSLFPYGGGGAAPWRPILLLNATHEESGKRIIASHVLIERNVFVDALDALHVLDSDVRASTAAHNSARFSYVSPAGNLGRRHGSGDDSGIRLTDWESWIEAGKRWLSAWNGSVIDGGYFENYGALTALELARAAEADLLGENAHVKLVILMISSDPDLAKANTLVRIHEASDGSECLVSSNEREHETPAGSPNYLSVEPGQVANAWLNEFVAPLQGVESAREAHGNRAAAELGIEVCTEFRQSAGIGAAPAQTPQEQAAITADKAKYADVTKSQSVKATAEKPYFAHFAMCKSKDAVQAPLGWVLSQSTQAGIADLLSRCQNAEQLKQLEAALGGSAEGESAANSAK